MDVGLEPFESGMEKILLIVSIHVILDGFVHLEPSWTVLASFVLLVVLQLAATLILIGQL